MTINHRIFLAQLQIKTVISKLAQHSKALIMANTQVVTKCENNMNLKVFFKACSLKFMSSELDSRGVTSL